MPLQIPFRILSGAGPHFLKKDDQFVAVNGNLDSANILVYLPAATLEAAPITVFTRREGLNYYVRLMPQTGKYIGGGAYHQFDKPYGDGSKAVFDGVEQRITVVPTINRAGSINGNWTILGGENVQAVRTSNAAASIAANADTALANLIDNVSAHDATGSMLDGTNGIINFPEYGRWHVKALISVSGMSAGEFLWASFGISSFLPRKAFVATGAATDRFQADWEDLFGPSVDFKIFVRHNSGASRNIALTSLNLRRVF